MSDALKTQPAPTLTGVNTPTDTSIILPSTSTISSGTTTTISNNSNNLTTISNTIGYLSTPLSGGITAATGTVGAAVGIGGSGSYGTSSMFYWPPPNLLQDRGISPGDWVYFNIENMDYIGVVNFNNYTADIRGVTVIDCAERHLLGLVFADNQILNTVAKVPKGSSLKAAKVLYNRGSEATAPDPADKP